MTHITDLFNKDICYFEFDIMSTIIAHELYISNKEINIKRKSLFTDKDLYKDVLTIEDAYLINENNKEVISDNQMEFLELVNEYVSATLGIPGQLKVYKYYTEAFTYLNSKIKNDKDYELVNDYLINFDDYDELIKHIRLNVMKNFEYSSYINESKGYNIGYMNILPEFWPLLNRINNVIYDGVTILEHKTSKYRHYSTCGKKRNELTQIDINKILKNIA